MFFHVAYEAGAGFTMKVEPGCQVHRSFPLAHGARLELLGDPIIRDAGSMANAIMDKHGALDLGRLFTEVPGHYYWFLWSGDVLECGSSFSAILPAYHCAVNGRIDICSSSFHLAREHALLADDRSYLLERELFNYPLFQRTPWKAIQLLPTNSKLMVRANKVTLERSFAIEEHFGDGSNSSIAALDELCDVFKSECDLQLPRERFALSFTGGFDGRTLLGAALALDRKDFYTYSFGNAGESDLTLPEEQARALGITHLPILLDDAYLKEHAFRSAIAFMTLSDHNGNLGRPHYHFAAQRLATTTATIITGNFGSELFRAMHNPGVMISSMLIRIFQDPDGPWQEDLLAEAGPEFQREAAQLISEIEEYLRSTEGLDLSGRFYRFVFEEVFRKYFGPEIIVQSHFLRNRTPFLSLRFIQALHGTVWAGVHARLFEQNKLRRMKGQVFYAAFLRRAEPRLYSMPTNKGYTPAEVLEHWKLPMLAAKVGLKQLFPKREEDSNAMASFHRMHYQALAAHYGSNDLRGPLSDEDDHGADRIRKLSNHGAWHAALKVNEVVPTGE